MCVYKPVSIYRKNKKSQGNIFTTPMASGGRVDGFDFTVFGFSVNSEKLALQTGLEPVTRRLTVMLHG